MAREDLRDIIRYIGQDNRTRANRFRQELRAKTERLADHPLLGVEGRLPGIRELVVHPNYVVFYRVLDGASTVQVLRVKHSAQPADAVMR